MKLNPIESLPDDDVAVDSHYLQLVLPEWGAAVTCAYLHYGQESNNDKALDLFKPLAEKPIHIARGDLSELLERTLMAQVVISALLLVSLCR